MGTKAVTVKVTNLQEDGKVDVTPAQPRIGIPVTTELTDSDIVAYGPMWQWQKGRTSDAPAAVACTGGDDVDADDWTNIFGANSATYEPSSNDLNYCLRAVAMYNDGFHEGTAETDVPNVGIYLDVPTGTTNANPRFDKTVNKALSAVQYPSNNLPPKFASASTKRFVPENVAAGNPIGKPVTANDPNGADDLAGYSLSGANQASFSIDAGTGQLMTRMEFDHEAKEKYTVTVTAEDSFGATDSIRVDIYVVDVDEAPEQTGTTMAANTVEYKENDTVLVLTLSTG